jgi:hypothetical protein
MSSDRVIYSCATCSKTIKGREHFATCVSCPRRVHRKCCDGRLSNSLWAAFSRTFTCSTCKAGMAAGCSRPDQHFNSNHCSDVSTSVPPTTINYEIMIGASRKGGDIVSDDRGYTYSFIRDYPNLRVWRCTFRGGVEFPCHSQTE